MLGLIQLLCFFILPCILIGCSPQDPIARSLAAQSTEGGYRAYPRNT